MFDFSQQFYNDTFDFAYQTNMSYQISLQTYYYFEITVSDVNGTKLENIGVTLSNNKTNVSCKTDSDGYCRITLVDVFPIGSDYFYTLEDEKQNYLYFQSKTLQVSATDNSYLVIMNAVSKFQIDFSVTNKDKPLQSV